MSKVKKFMEIEDLKECLNCGSDDLQRIEIVESQVIDIIDSLEIVYQKSKYQCQYCKKEYIVNEDIDEPDQPDIKEPSWQEITEMYRKQIEG